VNIEINKQNHLIFKIPLRSVFPFLPDNKVKIVTYQQRL